jgi:methyltransferase-like protein
MPAWYIAHEHLEETNQAFFFHEVAAHAAAHRLQYMCEADEHASLASLAPQARRALAGLAGDVVPLEQYLDFIRCRALRHTLLCHAGVALDRRRDPARLRRLQMSARVHPESATTDVRSGASERFSFQQELAMVTEPAFKAALVALAAARPRALGVSEVAAASASLLGGAPADEETAATLLAMHERGLIRQAAATDGVTNARHQTLQLDELERRLVVELDGGKDRAALAEILAAACERGELNLGEAAGRLDREGLRRRVAARIEAALERFAVEAVLVE